VTTFGIIIPFRPRSESSAWSEDLQLLNRTIESVLRQTYKHFRVYIVYTDAPDEQLEDPRLVYLAFPFGYQSWAALKNKDNLFLKFKSEKKAVRRWDKGRKLSYGSKLAKEDGCDYIMALDSDDLLSCYLLAHLASSTRNQDCKGWYMDKGYLYKQGSGYVIRVPRYMCGLNGSTHILRSDLVEIPDFNSLDWNDYNLFTDHGWVRERVKHYFNSELEPVPFFMLVYVVHQSNMSQVYQKEFGFHLKAIVKRILRSRPITRKFRSEFHIV